MDKIRTRPNPVESRMLSRDQAQGLAKGLGLFSLALGLAELTAPRAMARWLGMESCAPLLRAYGAREVGAGLAILVTPEPASWMWGRVAGDALDVATLAAGLREDNTQRQNVMIAMAAVAGVMAADVLCAQSLGQQQAQRRRQQLRAARDYRGRSGFNQPVSAMRGTARDFELPADMRIPEAMRPFDSGA